MAFHKAVAAFLDRALPEDAWWTTIPAGGGGLRRGVHFKAMGYKPGTPDILIIYRGSPYWLELKTKRGRASKAQQRVEQELWNAGCLWCWIANSMDQVEELLKLARIPLRAKVGV